MVMDGHGENGPGEDMVSGGRIVEQRERVLSASSADVENAADRRDWEHLHPRRWLATRNLLRKMHLGFWDEVVGSAWG